MSLISAGSISLDSTFKEPTNRFQLTNSARLCSPAGRYDNPIPTRFLSPIDCLKIPAQQNQCRSGATVHKSLLENGECTESNAAYSENTQKVFLKCTLWFKSCSNPRGCTTRTGYFKCREVKTGFYRNKSMQTGSSGTLIGWKSGQTTFVPLWDRMEGAWLRTQVQMKNWAVSIWIVTTSLAKWKTTEHSDKKQNLRGKLNLRFSAFALSKESRILLWLATF